MEENKDNAYQKKYYDEHKEKIRARRKELWRLKHPAVDEVPEHKPVKVMIRKKKILNNTFAELSELLKQRFTNPDTYTHNVTNLKTFMLKIMALDDFRLCIADSKLVIDKINSWKTSLGKPYSNGTKSKFYAILLIVEELLELPATEEFNFQFKLFKVKEMDENEDKMKTEVVPTFAEYLAKCKKTFGKFSKEYMIAKLYNEFTCRDDFALIVDEPDDGLRNFLIGDTVILNHYKKKNKYGVLKCKLSKLLSKQLQLYIATNHIKGYLFGVEHLSGIVSKMNKKMEYKGGINLLRHIKITDELKDASQEDRVTLLTKMGHSPSIQLKYCRQNKITE